MSWGEREGVLRPVTPCSLVSMVRCAIYVSGGVFFSPEGFIYRSTGVEADNVVIQCLEKVCIVRSFMEGMIDTLCYNVKYNNLLLLNPPL